MRYLLLVTALCLFVFGCSERPQPTVKDVGVSVKEGNVEVKVPGLNVEGKLRKGEATPQRTVAVLPFKMTTSSANGTALGATLPASLTRALSRNSELEVRSRAAVERHIGFAPLTIGEQLKVRAILTGEIKTVEGELVVSLELIDITRDGTQLWGEVYREREPSDANKDALVKFEERITKEVAEAAAERLGATKPKAKDEKK